MKPFELKKIYGLFSWEYNWQKANIGSGNKLAPMITCTDIAKSLWHHMAIPADE